VTAALFGVFGQNDVTLNLAPVVLSAASSILVWRIAKYVLAEPVAVLVGLATWVWPVAVVVFSSQEYGFRYATLTLGLTAILFAIQIQRRGSTWPRWLGFGLAIGACVWSSPESAYFVVPCALLALLALRPSPTIRSVAARLGTFLTGALVGALPLLWVAARSGLGVIVNPNGATYPGSTVRSRLSAFVKHSGPIATGMQRPITGRWLGGHAVGPVILVVIVVATVIGLVLALRCRPQSAGTVIPLASFVVLYPLFYVLFDPTIFWNDGRYIIYLPYVAAISAGFVSWLVRSPGLRVAVTAVVVILAAAATVYELPEVVPGFTAGDLTHPFSGTRQSLATLAEDLRREHVTIGYAGYWVAYDLDFEGRGSLEYTPSPPGVVRNQGYLQAADSSADPAWIVCAPDHAEECQTLLGHTSVDPEGVTEASLKAWLGSHGVQFMVVSGEGFEAVVPDTRVTPMMLGT
jgi:hypothetical protein